MYYKEGFMKNTEGYYLALAAIDRLDEVRAEKGISKTNLSKKLGCNYTYYNVSYHLCRIYKIDTLVKLAKTIDVSVEYILSGKNKQPYVDFNIDFSQIINTKIANLPDSLGTIRTRLKRKPNTSINLKTLYDFEQALKIPASKLIGVDK
jgi:transcriptional regulator with XRE-family HTH domain